MPKINVNPNRNSAASGTLTAGGITRRRRSFGWSWWTPWMMKWSRLPRGWSGSQWKTSRCSQYSVKVQISSPSATSSTISRTAVATVGAQPYPGDDHGHEEDRRHGGVDPREEVEEAVLEQLG